MGIPASYVDSSSFTVSGDQTSEFVTGRKIKADCGDDGFKYSIVQSSVYDDTTLVVVSVSDLTTNLLSVQYMGSGGNWIPEAWREAKLVLPRLV